jgi:hypothetical protein
MMFPRYDIFKLVDGTPSWGGTANSTTELKIRIRVLKNDAVRECMVVDRLTGHRSVVNCERVQAELESTQARIPSAFRHP